jgi:glutamyl-tRNA reductase
VTASHLNERSREAKQAEAIVQAEVERFANGQQTLSAVPAIVSLQQSMEELRQAELKRMQGKLQSLSTEQRNAVEALTRGLISKVLHQPLQAMKAAARNGDLRVVEAAQQIFGLSSPGAGVSSQGGGSISPGAGVSLQGGEKDAEPKKEAAAKSISDTGERDTVEATRH